MIVVIGTPIGRLRDDVVVAGGTASRVALAAAGLGRTVQLVGKTGDDSTADGVVLDLARGGVGHVALLRDPARATPLEATRPDAVDEPESDDDPTRRPRAHRPRQPVRRSRRRMSSSAFDTSPISRVVILAEPADPATIAVVADATRWGEARMVLVVPAGQTVPDGLPRDVVVFEAPTADPDGAFADLVGAFAASLDEGTEPGAAFRSSIASDGWTEAGGS